MRRPLVRPGPAAAPVVALLSLLLAVLGAAGCSWRSSRPNVIVILVDTLRADYLGTYGFVGDVSPNIDALASESVQFRRCIAQAPWTSPSVASFDTSLHPQNHCVANVYGLFCEIVDDEAVWSTLPDEAVTLAEVFHGAGYETAGFVGNWVVKQKFGFAQGFETYIEPGGEERHIENDDMIFQRAAQWLQQRKDDRPFLLYLHLMDVHAPYRITPQDIDAIRDSPSLGQDRVLTDQEIADRPVHLGARIAWLNDEMPRHLINWRMAYAAGVRGFDRKLGGFLQLLRERHVLDDTVLVFVADHGEEFVEHGAWEHGKTYYDEAIHVPLLIRYPGAERAGEKVDRVVSLIDVMPTLISMAGIDSDLPPMEGQDLGPIVKGDPSSTEGWAFSSALPQETATVAVEGADAKLILDLETGRVEAYDLADDPQERHDIAAERPDLVQRLKQRIDAHLEEVRGFPIYRPTPTPLSEEDFERLRSLGYLR